MFLHAWSKAKHDLHALHDRVCTMATCKTDVWSKAPSVANCAVTLRTKMLAKNTAKTNPPSIRRMRATSVSRTQDSRLMNDSEARVL